MKIVVLDGYTLNPGDLSWDALKAIGDCEIYDRTPASLTVERIGDAEIVLTNKVVIDDAVLKACPAMKYVGVLATGYNVIDLEATRKAGVVVTNIPAYSTDSVAQMVFAHLLNIVNQVQFHSEAVHGGEWVNSADFSFFRTPLFELSGKTLGIIGFGKIGQKVAEIGHAFGMKILFQNRSILKDISEDFKQCELDELLKESDVVSLNCPLTEANYEFIGQEKLALMKKGAVLINTGRGPLINEQDLADALNEGHLAAAGLDVLSDEPPAADHPLLTAQNCYLTPHIAWATIEARQRLMDIAVNNLQAFLNRESLNVIN
ncbi:D-2-hydroxyacid dehydrogenase [Sunxiuqinia elliptica]|uniref:Glycerate dehydrogenase n=1 Tax=Sunxiuqinia elliptica TaxID=655355 RepID=A0A1I2GZ49_9BACT|nr:D-2-hydroxyacid dehydrogenase [Sunxiuqinia elliptica]SFF22423.1 glycerate dehydrogenase [Sunxiuqinia elliptica]